MSPEVLVTTQALKYTEFKNSSKGPAGRVSTRKGLPFPDSTVCTVFCDCEVIHHLLGVYCAIVFIVFYILWYIHQGFTQLFLNGCLHSTSEQDTPYLGSHHTVEIRGL